MAGTKSIHGVTTSVFLYSTGTKDYYTADATGVKLYGEYIMTDAYIGDVMFDKPLLLIPEHVHVGTEHVSTSSYLFTTYVKDYGFWTAHVEITSTSKVLGLEDIVTEQKTLKDCFKLSLRFNAYVHETGQRIDGDTTRLFLCKGIGCVKDVNSDFDSTIVRSFINGTAEAY